TREMERQESELRLLEERENRYREQMLQNERRLAQLASEIERLNKNKEAYARELHLKRESLAAEKESYSRLLQKREQLEKEFLTGDVEEQQQRLYRAVARQKGIQASLEELQQQEERLSRRRAALLQEETSLAGEAAQLRSREEELASAAGEARERAAEVAAQAAAIERRLEELNRELESLLQEEQRCREEIGGAASRLQLLRDQEAGLSGYYRGVREIIQNRASLPGIVGPVVDLISVEERFLRAIEAALGAALQYIVVDNEKAALEAIRFLKERKLGWCTFLPLDTIRPVESGLERYPGWRRLEGVFGRASELVQVDPAYEKVVRYLLGSILICRDLKAATEAARAVNYSCRIITLEGDMINPGGAIRGGSMPRRSAGLPLGRRREIEELERALESLHKKRRSWEEQIAGVRQRIEQAAAEAAVLQQKQAELAGDLRKAEKAAEENATALRILEQRRQNTAAALRELDAEMEELLGRRKALKADEKSC
ncbi:MAG TPA: hypothetical protein PK568_10190, partial [Bacillota bacterium]|nr:hypothetical protein [Bacillota bacterium]